MSDLNVRKFTDLVRIASGKWPNWDPPIPIIVGDYGTLNENGELDVLGNVYKDPEILQLLNSTGMDLDLVDNRPGWGEPELDFILSSSGVQRGQFDVDQGVPNPIIESASIKGTWKFRDGKRGALIILHSPRQNFIPKPVLEKLLKVDLLKDKHIVTNTLACSAYFMYLSDKSGETLSVAFSPKTPAGSEIGAGWWASNETARQRKGFNPQGHPSFTPLFSLRRIVKRSWLHWRGTEETHVSDEYAWADAYPTWKPLDEDGEELDD